MKKIMFIYGSLAGLITIGSMIIGYFLSSDETHTGSMLIGYLIMLIALSLIFAGVKKYRDRNLGGVIRFWPAFLLGLGISVVAGIFYVIGWEGYLAATDYVFIEDYTRQLIAGEKADGVSGAELEALVEKMDKMKSNYANPLFRMPITFTEIFPVGLLVSLVSAAVLRNPRVFPARR